MTKIYRFMSGNTWRYTATVDEAKSICGEFDLRRAIYECRLIAPRTKQTVVDAANGRFDEVVTVWPPAV